VKKTGSTLSILVRQMGQWATFLAQLSHKATWPQGTKYDLILFSMQTQHSLTTIIDFLTLGDFGLGCQLACSFSCFRPEMPNNKKKQ